MDVSNSPYISVDGLGNLYTRWGLLLTNETELGTAEPKTYTVDIPGGNGVIDLTDALADDVVYDTREISLVLIAETDDYTTLRNDVYNALHGQRKEFSFSFDPEYTYTGRFNVEEITKIGFDFVQVNITVTADPYKSKGTQTYKLNATGGKLYRFESGRCKVRPVIECSQVCFVRALPDGNETIIPAGTYRLNDVLFTQGFNELWINTQKFWDITWDEIKEGGQFAKTWADLANLRWDEVQMLGQDTETVLRSWYDIGDNRWEDLGETGSNPKHWYDLNYTKNEIGDSYAYLSYEWKDL